jgi:hypothetical protein
MEPKDLTAASVEEPSAIKQCSRAGFARRTVCCLPCPTINGLDKRFRYFCSWARRGCLTREVDLLRPRKSDDKAGAHEAEARAIQCGADTLESSVGRRGCDERFFGEMRG